MKQVTVISGKGGTGKTSLVGAFASLSQNAVLADCDVDAANLHLLVCSPQTDAGSEPFISGAKAAVHRMACRGCGWCEEVCRFGAVRVEESLRHGGRKAVVDLISCEGCGACTDGCPEGALELKEHRAGDLLVTESRFGVLVHARLKPGEGSSGRLVTKVRMLAKTVADEADAELVLIDGSPGTGCPVIASLTGVDAALVITEPTLSGRSDLERTLALCGHFGTPACVVVNKCDLNEKLTDSICRMCGDKEVPVIGMLGFDPSFVEAVIAGKTLTEYCENGTSIEIRRIWRRLLQMLSAGASEGVRPWDPGL